LAFEWDSRLPTPTEPERRVEPEQPKINDRDKDWPISRVVDKRMHNGKLQYRVQFEGFSRRYNRWVSTRDMNAPDLIEEYERSTKQPRVELIRKPAKPCQDSRNPQSTHGPQLTRSSTRPRTKPARIRDD
jgi:hypothetical protein